ncbi:hypothetical protein ES288_A08G184900v1 [Gossypium darwinii]|uniref:Uncharacterized protein n=1 Tax=Gossypium darwinii TaxID=34276 RepID=A0A5D2FM65_GOSDA|nr:hypothetical protein ES288_A08G184900v1 [Gossypium darwinii]
MKLKLLYRLCPLTIKPLDLFFEHIFHFLINSLLHRCEDHQRKFEASVHYLSRIGSVIGFSRRQLNWNASLVVFFQGKYGGFLPMHILLTKEPVTCPVRQIGGCF